MGRSRVLDVSPRSCYDRIFKMHRRIRKAKTQHKRIENRFKGDREWGVDAVTSMITKKCVI
jgi:hypothetical protein